MHLDESGLPPSRIAVIGPGRVGGQLAAAATRAGHRVVAVAGGRESSRQRFVGHVAGSRSYDSVVEAARAAELVLLTTPDDVLRQVVTEIAVADGFRDGQRVVHTSGAQGLAPLHRAHLAGARIAACHPAQTIPSGDPDPDSLIGAAWAVTAEPDDRAWARDLVTQLGGDPYDVPEAGRLLYHAALVVASNAVGAAVATARQLLSGARVEQPAAFLGPLITASVGNVLERGADALTGPVVRGDVGTVHSHIEQLDADVPHLAAAYRHLQSVVLAHVRPALDPEVARQLDELLRHPT